jgi:hypothetical protein
LTDIDFAVAAEAFVLTFVIFSILQSVVRRIRLKRYKAAMEKYEASGSNEIILCGDTLRHRPTKYRLPKPKYPEEV